MKHLLVILFCSLLSAVGAQEISGLAAMADPLASADILPFTDVSDTTESPNGTTKKATMTQVQTFVLTDAVLTTSMQIPNGAAPTVDAFGELAGDNNLWAASRGAPIFYDGTAATALVNVLVSDTPTNGQVPTWNTGGTITWETGGGLSAPTLAGINSITSATGQALTLATLDSNTAINLAPHGTGQVVVPIESGTTSPGLAFAGTLAAGIGYTPGTITLRSGGGGTVAFAVNNSGAYFVADNYGTSGTGANRWAQGFFGSAGLKIGDGTNGPTITASGTSPNEELNLNPSPAGTGGVTIGGGVSIKKILSAAASLDFASTGAGAVADLTITVTGAAVGDVVALGVPNASITATSSFEGWVIATDTVNVRYSPKATEDPASGTFRATVIKH